MNKAGKYIGDIVYGANDGIITTFAIVSGVVGASLSSKVIIILGVSNLLADGFSMAASNYLARKSEKEYLERIDLKKIDTTDPIKSAFATFFAFVSFGLVPLTPFMLGASSNQFNYAILATTLVLFLVGSLRARVTGVFWLRAGLEMLFIGSLAALVAYAIGGLLGGLI